MMGPKKLKLSLKLPSKFTISCSSQDQTPDSNLFGLVNLSNLRPSHGASVHAQVYLVRTGNLRTPDHGNQSPGRRETTPFLQFKTSQDFQDFEAAEKLVESAITSKLEDISPANSKAGFYFTIQVPSHLPQTAKCSLADISYAVVVKCTMSNGESLWAGQALRISTRPTSPSLLLPTSIVTFPESPIAVRVTFTKPGLGSNEREIGTNLHMRGLSLQSNAPTPSVLGLSSTRNSETRWLTPRKIWWAVEEKTTVISGPSTSDGVLSVATATRSEAVRTVSKGKYRTKLKYPLSKLEGAGQNFDMGISFNISVPDDVDLTAVSRLPISGGHILHSAATSPPSQLLAHPSKQSHETRFAVCLEYKLRLCIHVGEDTFHEASGVLVQRDPSQTAYTVVCPLKTKGEAADYGDCGLQVALPTYDMATGK